MSQTIVDKREKTKGKVMGEEWERRAIKRKSEEWKSGDNRGEERENQEKRGGCSEVPRPSTGSAVRMINGN